MTSMPTHNRLRSSQAFLAKLRDDLLAANGVKPGQVKLVPLPANTATCERFLKFPPCRSQLVCWAACWLQALPGSPAVSAAATLVPLPLVCCMLLLTCPLIAPLQPRTWAVPSPTMPPRRMPMPW